MKARLKKRGSQIVRITHNGCEANLIKAIDRDTAREICKRFNSLPVNQRSPIKVGMVNLKSIQAVPNGNQFSERKIR